MKNITKYIVALIVVMTLMTSCHDESLDPIPEGTKIGLVRWNIVEPSSIPINLNTEDNVIVIELTSPEGTVDSFTLMGQVKNAATGGAFSEYYDMVTITEFPATLTMNAEDIVASFPDIEITHGTQFKFLGKSMSKGFEVNTDNVVGAGFDFGEDPHDSYGEGTGIAAPYLSIRTYYLLNPPSDD